MGCVRLLKQKILREEMVKISGKERSSSFYKNRISKKNWKKRANSGENTKAKAKKLRKSLQEKRRANKQRKTWVALRSVNEQNTWASLHHFSHISRRKYPSKPLAHSILDRTELCGSPLLKHSEITRCSELKQTKAKVGLRSETSRFCRNSQRKMLSHTFTTENPI